jgi:hypothetical protein
MYFKVFFFGIVIPLVIYYWHCEHDPRPHLRPQSTQQTPPAAVARQASSTVHLRTSPPVAAQRSAAARLVGKTAAPTPVRAPVPCRHWVGNRCHDL